MLGLPLKTEVKKQLPKSAIYTKFQLNNAQKERVDADIAKLFIVNEILPTTISISAGKNINAFFVVAVCLKKKDFDDNSIIMISKLIPQNILFALDFEDELKLAVYHHNKLLQTPWQPKDTASITFQGLDLDAVWENLIIQIGDIKVKQGNTLDEQIVVDEKRKKLQKEKDRLTNLARKEKQPKKKFELAEKAKALQAELDALDSFVPVKAPEVKVAQEKLMTEVKETVESKAMTTNEKADTVKALSIMPEYAADIFDGFKTVEWRSWKTDYRGDLLICASSRKCKGCIAGHALCMVTLKDVVPFTRRHLNAAMMDFVPNPPGYAWILDNVRLIKPFPYKGKLHIYDVDASLVEVLSPIQTKEADEEFEKYYKQLYIEAGGEF